MFSAPADNVTYSSRDRVKELEGRALFVQINMIATI